MFEENERPIIVTLCGSTKFKREFLRCQKELTLRGQIVLSVGFFGHADGDPVDHKDKVYLDILHLRKIEMSDYILVVDVGGYVGESTEREIAFADSIGLRVEYLSIMDKKEED